MPEIQTAPDVYVLYDRRFIRIPQGRGEELRLYLASHGIGSKGLSSRRLTVDRVALEGEPDPVTVQAILDHWEKQRPHDNAMTVPIKNEKCSLQIKDHPDGFSITADAPHADELLALFTQRGIPCRAEDAGRGKKMLVFDSEVEREAAEELLQESVQAKGA